MRLIPSNSRNFPSYWVALLALSLGFSVCVNANEATSAPVDFDKQIRPIFKESCVSCHGTEKQKGGLRLDVKTLAMKGGASGPSILPGKADESLFILRVLGKGEDPRMPLKAAPLPDAQVALLKNWINQGAPWPEDTGAAAAVKSTTHWSYVKPVHTTPPAVKDPSRVRNAVDNFILAKLDHENLKPNPEAPRETLIRRLSLDLIGLPPTVKEVDEFVADTTPDAYEKVVNRLLASPHYGERWARPWLDLARYADTNGYEKDNRRSMYLWRDWVINAFNSDMPFDQFTIEQFAGDLLPNATRDQKIATGFHRNTMTNEEGGVDQAEHRWETLCERVNTTATVWLGSTMACAQCHNHKFDPFPQKDYYRMLAFFETTDEPKMDVMDPALEPRKKELETKIAELKKKFDASTPELEAAQAEWEKKQGTPVTWTVWEAEAKSKDGSVFTKMKDGAWLVTKATPADDYTLTAPAPKKVTALKLEALTHEGLPSKGPGASGNGNFVLSEIKIKLKQGDKEIELPISSAFADFEQDGWPVSKTFDGKSDTGWAVSPQVGKAHQATFILKEPAESTNGTLTVWLECRSPHAQHTLGHFRLSTTDAADPKQGGTLPGNIHKLLAIEPAKREEKQKKELAAYYRRSVSPALADTRKELEKDESELKGIPRNSTLVMQEKGNAKPETYLRVRGAYLTKGELVSAGTPSALHAFNPNYPVNRLGLARWLVDPENPLTSRVIVNRIWENIFGRGILETSEDFGTQTPPPTHPELLDWLATEFMQKNWSTKTLLKTIVMSATYRQSAKVLPEVLEKDPYNRLLARASRFRLEAEMVRDAALFEAGQLTLKVGGPSVFPPQPDGIWNIPYNGDKWVQSEGDDAFRRGMYTFLRRTSPYPSFMTFDAPSREQCTVRRVRTNTPLQALVTLNDPVYMDAARGLAKRMLTEANAKDLREQLKYGLRICIARQPQPMELDRLENFVKLQQERLGKNAEAVKQIVKNSAPAGVETASYAAMTLAANVLLNMDETLTKE